MYTCVYLPAVGGVLEANALSVCVDMFCTKSTHTHECTDEVAFEFAKGKSTNVGKLVGANKRNQDLKDLQKCQA